MSKRSSDLRQCKYQGKLKIKYATQEEAEKALVFLQANNFLLDKKYEIYPCKLCSKYHIGHRRSSRKKKKSVQCERCNTKEAEFIIDIIEDDTLIEEMGKTILSCLGCVKEIQREMISGLTVVRKRKK